MHQPLPEVRGRRQPGPRGRVLHGLGPRARAVLAGVDEDVDVHGLGGGVDNLRGPRAAGPVGSVGSDEARQGGQT